MMGYSNLRGILIYILMISWMDGGFGAPWTTTGEEVGKLSYFLTGNSIYFIEFYYGFLLFSSFFLCVKCFVGW